MATVFKYVNQFSIILYFKLISFIHFIGLFGYPIISDMKFCKLTLEVRRAFIKKENEKRTNGGAVEGRKVCQKGYLRGYDHEAGLLEGELLLLLFRFWLSTVLGVTLCSRTPGHHGTSNRGFLSV